MYQVNVYNNIENKWYYPKFENEREMALYLTTIHYKPWVDLLIRVNGKIVYMVHNKETYNKMFNKYRRIYLKYKKGEEV